MYPIAFVATGGKRQKVEDDPRVTALREVSEETAGQASFEQLCRPFFVVQHQTAPVFTTLASCRKSYWYCHTGCDPLGGDHGKVVI